MNTQDNEPVQLAAEVKPSTPAEALESNLVTAEQAKELEEVKSIDVFATNIVNWHTHNMNQLIHVIGMPEFVNGDEAGIRITITSDNVERGAVDGKRILHPKEIEAFKAGVRYAFDQCNELPFKFIPTDADGNIQPEYESVDGTDEQQVATQDQA